MSVIIGSDLSRVGSLCFPERNSCLSQCCPENCDGMAAHMLHCCGSNHERTRRRHLPCDNKAKRKDAKQGRKKRIVVSLVLSKMACRVCQRAETSVNATGGRSHWLGPRRPVRARTTLSAWAAGSLHCTGASPQWISSRLAGHWAGTGEALGTYELWGPVQLRPPRYRGVMMPKLFSAKTAAHLCTACR
jgi:hypothetical protein